MVALMLCGLNSDMCISWTEGLSIITMNRLLTSPCIDQVMAIPVGKAIMLFHIARLYMPPRACLGSSEDISEAAFDLTSLTFLLATTRSGALLTFNTKTKDERNKDTRCSLMRMVPGGGGGGQREEAHGKQLVSLKGYMLSVGAEPGEEGLDSCHVSILNTSDIKRHREVGLGWVRLSMKVLRYCLYS